MSAQLHSNPQIHRALASLIFMQIRRRPALEHHLSLARSRTTTTPVYRKLEVMGTPQLQRRIFLEQSLLAAPAIATLSNLVPADLRAEQAAKPKPQLAPAARPTLTLNIRDYGALGDGTTKDTAAIQQT